MITPTLPDVYLYHYIKPNGQSFDPKKAIKRQELKRMTYEEKKKAGLIKHNKK